MVSVAHLAAADPDGPLHRAVRTGNPANIQKSLDAGEDINALGEDDNTPLMLAALTGEVRQFEFLLSKGADPTISDKDDFTPMHGAAFMGRPDIVKMLIEHKIDPSDRHEDGLTPIHRACQGDKHRHTDTVEVLLEAGVAFDEATDKGQTPLDFVRGVDGGVNHQTERALERAANSARKKANKKKAKKKAKKLVGDVGADDIKYHMLDGFSEKDLKKAAKRAKERVSKSEL